MKLIDNQDTIEQVILRHSKFGVRLLAIDYLDDQEQLRLLKVEVDDLRLQWYIALKLDDQLNLHKLALADELWLNHGDLAKFTDKELLLLFLEKSNNIRKKLEIYQILQLPGCELLDSLTNRNGSHETRWKAAQNIIALAKASAEPFKYIWKYLVEVIESPYQTNVDRCGNHYDGGIGIDFLPYPFHD